MALLIVIMAMLILSSLSLLALSAIVVQAKPTQFQQKTAQTGSAAEAGIDAGLAAIRNGSYVEGTKTYGDRSQLPCWNNYTGQVAAAVGAASTYQVTIKYFLLNPAKQTDAWRTANAIPCTSKGTSKVPMYAFITSSGVGVALPNQAANAGNRILQSLYTFDTTNPNLPGGLIKDASNLCYTAATTVGGTITMQTCVPGSPSQMWAYTNGFQLVLTATRAPDGTGGNCLTALLTGSMTTVNATMQVCDPNAMDYTQKWGVNDSDPVAFFGHLKGVSSYPTSQCLGVASAGVGAVLRAGAGCNGVYPQAEVGAGAAGTDLKTPAEVSGQPFQWVNYQEFGRCLDVTGWNVSTVSQILYPCKQDPMQKAILAATPGWNEVFVWDQTTKRFFLRKDASSNKPYSSSNPAYCMRSPNTNGGYVLFGTLCTSITVATSASFTWTVNRADTGSPTTDYTIVDAYGRCLSAGAKNPSNTPNYSSVTTAACDGSGSQKWNAPPSLGKSAVSDTVELPNR